MRTFTIELRADFQENDKYDLMLEAARATARELLATAMLLKDKRDPHISLQCGDMFEQDRDLEIFSPEGGE